eukprot:688744-Amphidinium_carterae.1
MQPPATDREITQKEKRDEKVAEWHEKVLSKPGVERVDWPDGFPVNAPYPLTSVLWFGHHCIHHREF